MYISSPNLFSSMRQSVLQTQTSLSTAQAETTSGIYADLGLHLGGKAGSTISFAQESGHLSEVTASNTAVATRLSTTSSAIDSIMSDAQALSNVLIGNGSSAKILASTTTQAQFSFQSLISKLNTYVGGQYVFGGINTAVAPMGDFAATSDAADQALKQDLPADTSQTTPADIAAAASGSGEFGALFEAGGAKALTTASTTQVASQVAPGQFLTTSVSANQAAFQQIAKAYALLSNLGGKDLGDKAGEAVISTATQLLNAGLAGLTEIQANVGTAQNAVSAANDRMSAQQVILTSSVDDMEKVDTYSLSTKLTALSNQLQVAYSLTSQLKSLSLVNYLTGG